jgi:predicted RNA-binding Zn ribbon-like protein
LDFINSIESPRSSPVDFLNDYDDLIDWAEHVGLVHTTQAAKLREGAQQMPEDAATAFRHAIALREVLYRIFLAEAHKTQPDQDDMNHLKRAYITALSHANLSLTPDEYQWQWPTDDGELDTMLWAIAHAAVDLLCSPNVQRIKECPGADDCGWLFLDASKNGTRRWCSMEGCGSRVKMRRQYARRRSLGP